MTLSLDAVTVAQSNPAGHNVTVSGNFRFLYLSFKLSLFKNIDTI